MSNLPFASQYPLRLVVRLAKEKASVQALSQCKGVPLGVTFERGNTEQWNNGDRVHATRERESAATALYRAIML